MDYLNQRLNYLESRIELLERKVAQIPIPFKLMYRPPYQENHMDIVEYLDKIDKRLEQIENNNNSCSL